jgi:hypothetical protein
MKGTVLPILDPQPGPLPRVQDPTFRRTDLAHVVEWTSGPNLMDPVYMMEMMAWRSTIVFLLNKYVRNTVFSPHGKRAVYENLQSPDERTVTPREEKRKRSRGSVRSS